MSWSLFTAAGRGFYADSIPDTQCLHKSWHTKHGTNASLRPSVHPSTRPSIIIYRSVALGSFPSCYLILICVFPQSFDSTSARPPSQTKPRQVPVCRCFCWFVCSLTPLKAVCCLLRTLPPYQRETQALKPPTTTKASVAGWRPCTDYVRTLPHHLTDAVVTAEPTPPQT